MGKRLTAAGLSIMFVALAVGCSSSTGPEPIPFPTNAAAFHYTGPPINRFYEVSLLDPPDSGRTADTLIDSTWQLYNEDGILWARSYRAFRRYDRDSAGNLIRLYDSAASILRIGLRNDTLFFGPSPLQPILVGPIGTGNSWCVSADTVSVDSIVCTIQAFIVGEEELPLQIGLTRTWHVTRGAVGQDWFAPGLGRAQYQEINGNGDPILAKLIAVGNLE
jgi:hypothetical protein